MWDASVTGGGLICGATVTALSLGFKEISTLCSTVDPAAVDAFPFTSDAPGVWDLGRPDRAELSSRGGGGWRCLTCSAEHSHVGWLPIGIWSAVCWGPCPVLLNVSSQ